MNRVWEDSEQSGGSLLVLLAMADNADHHGICWPSTPYIARKARLSERQAQRVIDKLIADGEMCIVKKDAGRGKRTVYRVTIKGDIVSSIANAKGDIGGAERVTSATLASNKEEPSVEPPLPAQARVAKIFGRKPSTKWSAKETKALKDLLPIDEEEFALIERYYAKNRKKQDNICRRDVLRLLTYWSGEVDRARMWCEKNPAPGQRKIEQAPAAERPLDEAAVEAERSRTRGGLAKFRERMRAGGNGQHGV